MNKRVVVWNRSIKRTQVLAKYKIDPEKFEIIEIDHRKDMDQIQTYMKKVKFFHGFENEKLFR